MIELTRKAQPLLKEPLVPPPSIGDLKQRTKHRQRRRVVIAGGSTGVVVLTVCLVVALLPSASQQPTATKPASTLASFIQQGVSVPDSTLTSVGLPPDVTPLSSLQNQMPLTDGGKPAVVYVGAEYCPYCAIQRWALIVALSRFGTFSNLGQQISSSSTDVFPGLQSWSFNGSTYSSPYITFDAAETYSSVSTETPSEGGYEPLESMSSVESGAINSLDSQQALPFLDIGNRYVNVGASSSPAVLQNLTLDQIASDLSDPSNPVAQSVDGIANYIVAAICSVVPRGGVQLCSSPTVPQAQVAMAASPFNASEYSN